MYKNTLQIMGLSVVLLHSASASLILSSANFVNGTGLGTEPTLLTIQNSPTEIGCAGFSSIGSTFSAVGVCQGSAADVKTGSSQIGPQSLAGITTAANFGVVFNADQPAGGPITLTGLTASFYTSSGVFLFQTTGLSCAAAGVPNCTITNTASGIGKSGFLFKLDAADQLAATTAGVFSSGTSVVGLSASASTSSGGPETFYLANLNGGGGGGGGGQTPEPSSVLLLSIGVGLLGIASTRKVRASSR